MFCKYVCLQHANTMAIYSRIIDRTGGPRAPVLSIASKYMGMVLAYPCLALEAQLLETTHA